MAQLPSIPSIGNDLASHTAALTQIRNILIGIQAAGGQAGAPVQQEQKAALAALIADTLKLNKDAPSTPILETIYKQCIPKAWAYCTVAGGAVTVQSGFNVSSVTYNGAGTFTINFATALSDAKYSAVCMAGNTALAVVDIQARHTGARTASAFQVDCYSLAGVLTDPDSFSILVFGN